MTAGNVQSLSGVDAGDASYFFSNTAAAYGAGASLVKTPVQAHYATTPVLSLHVLRPVPVGYQQPCITYPYKWVMYNPESWAATPVNEQQDPVESLTLFGQLAHANGLKVIQAPALDLAWVPGCGPPAPPRRVGRSVVRPGKPRRGSHGRRVTSSSSRMSRTPPPGGQYAYMFNTTQTQAQAANSSVRVFSEVSTLNGTAGPDGHRGPVHQPRRLLCRSQGERSRRLTSSSG